MTGLAGAALAISAGAILASGSDDPGVTAAPAPAAEPSQPPNPFTPEVQVAGRTLQDPEIDELSGLAASRLHPGVLYGVNDSGGAAVVYAIDSTGATVGRLNLSGVKAQDWEAIAPGWDARGNPVLWIGDIGGNTRDRDQVQVYQISEPSELGDVDVPWQSFTLTYPDGPNDAEALLVDPDDHSLSLVSKGKGVQGFIYHPPWPLEAKGDNLLTKGQPVPGTITDGGWELSPEGAPRLVLIDYWRIHRWTGDAWVSQLGPLMLQREALAWPWLPDGPGNNSVLLGSEGAGSSIVPAEVP